MPPARAWRSSASQTSGTAPLGLVVLWCHGGKDALDGIGRAQMVPKLRRTVVEGRRRFRVLPPQPDSWHHMSRGRASRRHGPPCESRYGVDRADRIRRSWSSPWEFIENIADHVRSVTLIPSGGEHYPRGPSKSRVRGRRPPVEEQCAGGGPRDRSATPASSAHSPGYQPGNIGTPSFRRGADQHENALCDPSPPGDRWIGPDLNITPDRKVAPVPVVLIFLSARSQTGDRRGRQVRRPLAQQGRQCLPEISHLNAAQVKKGQQRRHSRSASLPAYPHPPDRSR
jgi:hypothetical protein